MRFILILLLVVVAAMVGLFIYGQMLEPDTTTIEQEVSDAAS